MDGAAGAEAGAEANRADRAGDLQGFVDVARAHREHERFHSVFKLEEAVAWRRDSNALKLLADHWSDPARQAARSTRAPADPAFGAVGCEDLNEPAVVATSGILFMEGAAEPAELTTMRGRWDTSAKRYRGLSQWLNGHMTEEWPRLSALLTPELIATARPRLMALTRTTSAAGSYTRTAHLLTAAATALGNQDLTPAGVRADRLAAAAMLRTAAWLVDVAAATVAEAGASLSLSDPDWTQFIDVAGELVDGGDGTEPA